MATRIGETHEGLEGVVACKTMLSDVNGNEGRLIVAGEAIETLARGTFEATAARLAGALDGVHRDPTAMRTSLGEQRLRAFAFVPTLGGALLANDGMDALRGAMSQLRAADVADDERNTFVLAATSVFAAAWARVRVGKAPVAPDADASHAEDYLRMVTGSTPTAPFARALDAYLTTVCDHGMNASTFAARVVASTGSDVVSAIVAAIGALKGPLHGGAPGPVLDMLDAIGDPARAEAWIDGELAAKRRIMGLGHRIYRVRDPRAFVLERATADLEASGLKTPRLALVRAVERLATSALARKYRDRPLHANVELYTAILLDAVGLPRELFTPTFAVGRVVGWCAHVEEQRRSGRLIRPESVYVGAQPAAA